MPWELQAPPPVEYLRVESRGFEHHAAGEMRAVE